MGSALVNTVNAFSILELVGSPESSWFRQRSAITQGEWIKLASLDPAGFVECLYALTPGLEALNLQSGKNSSRRMHTRQGEHRRNWVVFGQKA
jgi:hypothetical protein